MLPPKESEQVDADAVLLLATAAQGSLRDALVLLEQALGAGERPVTVAVARRSLGLTDPSILQALVTSLAGADPAGTLRAAAAAFDAGADPRQLFRDVARLARAAELVALGYPEGASVGPDEVALVTDLGAIAPAGLWLRLLELIAEAEMNLRQSVDARMLVEVCLLRALRPPGRGRGVGRDGRPGSARGGVGAGRGRDDARPCSGRCGGCSGVLAGHHLCQSRSHGAGSGGGALCGVRADGRRRGVFSSRNHRS